MMIDLSRVFFRIHLVLLVIFFTQACSSGVTKIERYGLKIMDKAPSTWQAPVADVSTIIAVYPVRLPSYLETPSIVSLTDTQKIRVSRNHMWAGDLESESTRILSKNISLLLPTQDIVRFPWGQNIEPDYSIRISIDEMSGQQGGEVILKAQWQIFHIDKKTKFINKIFREEFKEPSLDDSYDAYVAACNRLIEKLSLAIASQTKLRLDGHPF